MEHPRHAQGSAGRSSPPRPAPKDWTVGSGPDPVRGRVVERAGIRARASAARVVGELLRKIAERSSSAQRSVARPWGGGGAAPVHQCARTAHPSRPCRSGPRRGRRGDPLACCCRGPHLRRCRPRMPRTGHGRAVDRPGRLAREPRPVPGLRRGCVRSCRRGQRGRRPLRGQPPSRAVRLGPPPWRAPGTPSTRRSETPPEGAASAVTECPRPLVARPPIDVGPGRVLGEGHPTARRRIRVLGLVSQTTRRRRPASCGRERHEGGSRLYRWSSIDHATRDRDRGVLRRRCPATSGGGPVDGPSSVVGTWVALAGGRSCPPVASASAGLDVGRPRRRCARRACSGTPPSSLARTRRGPAGMPASPVTTVTGDAPLRGRRLGCANRRHCRRTCTRPPSTALVFTGVGNATVDRRLSTPRSCSPRRPAESVRPPNDPGRDAVGPTEPRAESADRRWHSGTRPWAGGSWASREQVRPTMEVSPAVPVSGARCGLSAPTRWRPRGGASFVRDVPLRCPRRDPREDRELQVAEQAGRSGCDLEGLPDTGADVPGLGGRAAARGMGVTRPRRCRLHGGGAPRGRRADGDARWAERTARVGAAVPFLPHEDAAAASREGGGPDEERVVCLVDLTFAVRCQGDSPGWARIRCGSRRARTCRRAQGGHGSGSKLALRLAAVPWRVMARRRKLSPELGRTAASCGRERGPGDQ